MRWIVRTPEFTFGGTGFGIVYDTQAAAGGLTSREAPSGVDKIGIAA